MDNVSLTINGETRANIDTLKYLDDTEATFTFTDLNGKPSILRPQTLLPNIQDLTDDLQEDFAMAKFHPVNCAHASPYQKRRRLFGRVPRGYLTAALMAFAVVATFAVGIGLPAQALARTITATSCSQGDVNAAMSQAGAGDTVAIPAGTCSWTSSLSLSPPANVTLLGAGDLGTVGGDDLTVIVDDYRNTNGSILQINAPSTGVFRMAGITFRNGSGGLKNNAPIQISRFR